MPVATDLFPVELAPVDAYFEPIDLERGTDITVGGLDPSRPDEAFGYFFHWGDCVQRGYGQGDCWRPIRSPSGYQGFHQGHVITASNTRVALGLIGSNGHAPPDATIDEAVRHYQDPTHGKIRGRIYENQIGAYIHGQLMPGVTYLDVEMIRASALSGHWQWRENMPTVAGAAVSGIDCLGPCLVMRPGLALDGQERFALAAAASAPDGTVVRYHSILEAPAMAATAHSFDHDGLHYAQRPDGSYEVSTPEVTKSCACEVPEPVAAAAASLETAASQADLDAAITRIDELERAFTAAEGERMTADDVSVPEE